MSDFERAELRHQQLAERLVADGVGMWIDGEFVREGEPRDAVDPFVAQPFASVPDADATTVDRAVAAAKKAQAQWVKTSARDRAKALRKLASCLREVRKDLVAAECLNAGIPKMLASRFSVSAAVRSYEYFAEWADKIYGEVVPTNSPGVLDFTRREPLGVVAAITAWNTPTLFLGSKVAPALAAGNAVVIKPSERAPLPAHLFAKAAAAAGLPKGLINVVYGAGETGAALVGHPDVDMVTFTGGTETGKRIAAAAGLRPTCLELGGKSAAIVFGDANLDQAAFQLTFGSFGLSGQACAASSRLLIERGAYDAFIDKLAATATNMAMGDPLDDGTMLGPLISEASVARVEGLVEEAKQAGAEVVFGGERHDDGVCARGHFYRPTLLGGVNADADVAREEIFGPVACAFAFDKPADALELANRSRYGLAASVWTRSLKRAHNLSADLAAGYVWVNSYGAIPYSAPFGGIKDSGHGREGGRDALMGFTRLKNVYVQL